MKSAVQILFYFFSLHIWMFANAQTVEIKGKVLDDQGNPLPYSNIYIEGSSIGTYSNSSGEYSFRTKLKGSYKLNCSFTGYITKSKFVSITEADLLMDFQLNRSVEVLDEVVVEVKKDRKWGKQYKAFEELFIGRDENRFYKKCEILNPYVLEFYQEDGFLKASANLPLKIVNNALGYEIYYELISFISRKGEGSYRFWGHAFFKELVPKDEKQKNKWITNRSKVYQGSKRHFLRSLASNDLDNAGYETYFEDVPLSDVKIGFSSVPKKVAYSELAEKKNDYTSMIKTRKLLRVEYIKRQEWHAASEAEFNETTWITFHKDDVIFDHDGHFLKPYETLFFGTMAREALATSLGLPSNYEPTAKKVN